MRGALERLANGHALLLFSRERVAIQVLETTAQLAALLREYLDSVRFDLADLDDDVVDPF